MKQIDPPPAVSRLEALRGRIVIVAMADGARWRGRLADVESERLLLTGAVRVPVAEVNAAARSRRRPPVTRRGRTLPLPLSAVGSVLADTSDSSGAALGAPGT